MSVLATAADRSKLAPLAKQDWAPEALALGTRVVYQWCPKEILDSAVASYPLDMDLTARAGPRDRLRAFIRAFLFRTLDEGRPAWHGHLMVREMAEPVALDSVVARTIRPMFPMRLLRRCTASCKD